MKFSCTQENLSQGLSMVSHGATKNVNLEILNNVLVRIEDKAIRLTTTNLEIALTTTVRGKVDAPGEFTVPAKLFADFVKLMPNDRVEVALKDDVLHVDGPSTKTKMKGMPAAEFPLIPTVERTNPYRVPVADLQKALSRVIFAVSPNESRPELSGVLFRFVPNGTEGELVLAATDSYRLAEARVPLHAPNGLSERSVIVPARTAAELLRVLSGSKDPDGKATVEIVIADNQVLFIHDAVELISRTIEGKYPEYRAVIPEGAKTTVTIPSDELAKAVHTAALFAQDKINDVHLAADAAGKRLTIRAADGKTGENESVLLGDVGGTDNSVTLNYHYLLQGVNALDGEHATLKVVDAMTPCVLAPSSATAKYLYIVMPIKQ